MGIPKLVDPETTGNQGMGANEDENLVTKKDLRRMALRSLTMQGSWNYERQMNMAFMYSIAPILDKIYKHDPEKRKEAYKRHMAFFNCTPQTSSFVIGIAASMEEKYAKNAEEGFNPETINAVKAGFMGPLAGIGDSLFQGTFRIITFGIGISLAQQGSVLGPILAVLLFAIPSLLTYYYGAFLGYSSGDKLLSKASGGLMDKVMYMASVVGLMVIGGMVASLVGITTPIKYNGLVLQDVLNSIMPQGISLLITFFMYWLLRKKVSTTWVLIGAIGAGILFSVLGIFN